MANLIPEETSRFADPNDVNSQIREYVKIKSSIDMMETRQKELREKLFDRLDNEGEEDSKGNLFYELDTAIEGVVRIEKQRRVSRKLDEDMVAAIITDEALQDTIYKVVRVVDEDALMAAFYDGKITEDQLDSMFPPKVTWALMTKKS